MASSLPPGVDLSAALSSYLSSKPRPSVLSHGHLVQEGDAVLSASKGKNTRRIYCPRDGCGCLILRAGDAELKEGLSGVYDSSGPFPPAPLSSSSQPYWYITTSPMGFENVGFSRTVPPSHTLPSNLPKGNLKYLICADCDLGPLGWTMEGSKEAWMGVERVGYGQEEEKSS